MIPNEEFWRVRSAILLAMRSEGPEQLDSLAESLKDKVDNDTGRRLPVEAYRLLYAAVLIGRLDLASVNWLWIMGILPRCVEQSDGRAWLLGVLATEAAREYDHTGESQLLTSAETVFLLALAETEEGDEQHAKVLISLAMLRIRSCRRTHDPDDGRRAAEFARRALRSAPDGSALWRNAMLQLCVALLEQASCTSDGHDYADEGIAAGMTLLGSLSGGADDAALRSETIDILRTALLARAQVLVAVSEAVIRAYRDLPPEYPDSDGSETAVRCLAGALIGDSAAMTGDAETLDAAIDGLTVACNRSSSTDPLIALGRAALVQALRRRSELTGSVTDLETAVTAAREALAASENPRAIIGLAEALIRLGELSASIGPLNEAIQLLEPLAAGPADDNADRISVLNSLCMAFRFRAELTRLPTDATMAIDYGHDAVELASQDLSGRATLAVCLLNLGTALQVSYSLTGDAPDLEEAIRRLRASVDVTPTGDGGRAMRLSNLGSALADRYRRSNALSDLDEAIEVTQQAVNHAAPDSFDYARFLGNLCGYLGSRSQRHADRGSKEPDLRRARETGRAAVAASPPGHPLRGLHLTNLAGVLLAGHDETPDPAELAEAARYAREAVAASGDNSPYRRLCTGQLAAILLRRYQLTRNPAELREATSAARDAVAGLPEQSPDYAEPATLLAQLLIEANQPDGIRQAATLADKVTNAESTETALRVNAAKLKAIALEQAGASPDEIYQAYRQGVELLPLLAWRGIGNRDQESLISENTDLASRAAEFALEAEDANGAVEVLEMGRGVLWAQMLDLRSDLEALHTQDPELARRLDNLRTIIDAGGTLLRTPQVGQDEVS